MDRDPRLNAPSSDPGLPEATPGIASMVHCNMSECATAACIFARMSQNVTS